MARKGFTRKTYDFRISVIAALKRITKHFNDRTEVETVERIILEKDKTINEQSTKN